MAKGNLFIYSHFRAAEHRSASVVLSTGRTRLIAVALVDAGITGRRLGPGEQQSSELLLTTFVKNCSDCSNTESQERQHTDQQRRLVIISRIIIIT